jgi:GR25 family glycosyltransferase involved in LPS biosynthesis
MSVAYTILEVDRHDNANLLRNKLSFLDEMKTVVCDARQEYPDCINKYPEYKHIFDSITNLGLIGLWISNFNAFYQFLDSDYDSLLVLEDDVQLVDGFESIFKKCLEELTEDAGVFSIGYRDTYTNDYTAENAIPDKKYICDMFQTGDSWGIVYRKDFVRDMLHDIAKYKILGGFSDTAIMSYALKKVSPICKYKAYSVPPSIGSLLIHDNAQEVSSLQNSPIISNIEK